MTTSVKQRVIGTVIASLGAITVYVILLFHNAWGDERYELKADAAQKEKQFIRKEIGVIDRELGLLDQEIIFAESENAKRKYEAMKALYERDKEALQEELEDKG